MTSVLLSSTPNPEKLEDFWQQLMTAADDAGRNQFAVAHLPLVRHTAMRIRSRLPDLVELDDLVQVGMMGLHRAMLAFNPRRHVKFTTFAPFYIRGAIFDHLRATDWVPRLVRHRTRMFEVATSHLQQKLGRSPSDQELADYLQFPPEVFAHLRKDARAVTQVSLNQTRFTDDSGRPVSQADLCPDPKAPDPVMEAQRRNLKDLITRGFECDERLILILYYYEEMTMKEIGSTLAISESRVSQMHTSIIDRLKARLREQEHELEPEE